MNQHSREQLRQMAASLATLSQGIDQALKRADVDVPRLVEHIELAHAVVARMFAAIPPATPDERDTSAWAAYEAAAQAIGKAKRHNPPEPS